MSIQESRITIILVGLILLLSMSSCKSDLERKKEFYNAKSDTFKKTNNEVFLKASDTIRHWVDLELTFYYRFNHKVSWAQYDVDNWILFNSKMDKCIVNVLVQNVANKQHDDIIFLLGEKYGGEWWFYDGPDMVIIQENYIKDTAVYALPFSTLREIARKNTLSWYYIEKPSGTCLKKLFSEGYDSYKKCSDEKYIINDQYFETGFNWEADRKNYPKFLKERFEADSTALNH